MNLLHHVQEIIHQELDDQEMLTVIVAVSGGVDSMVLLDLLRRLATDEFCEKIRLVVAHFDHQIRSSSRRDAEFVVQYCQKYDIAYMVERWQGPVPLKSEEDARQARYGFFARVYEAFGGQMLVTGHHLDDQVETILMRFVRGTGLRGLQGIQASQDFMATSDENHKVWMRFIRPLLTVSKEDILDYAADNQVRYVEDETNQSEIYFRNRIRHSVIPHLERENNQFYRHIQNYVSLMQTSYQAHFENFMKEETKLGLPCGRGWRLNLPQWWQLSQETRKIYLSILMEERWVTMMGPYSLDLVDRLLDLMDENKPPQRWIPYNDRWIIRRTYNYIEVVASDTIEAPHPHAGIHMQHLNQWYALNDQERIGIFEERSSFDAGHITDSVLVYLPDWSQCPPLSIRHRQDGDWIMCKDASGKYFRKKISRIFIDQKIPSDIRDQAWLVCVHDDECLWLVNHRKSARVHPQEKSWKPYRILYEKTREKR